MEIGVFPYALALVFIIKLRFTRKKNIHEYVKIKIIYLSLNEIYNLVTVATTIRYLYTLYSYPEPCSNPPASALLYNYRPLFII